MTELNSEAFSEFFNALWDHRPFAWQQELADRVLEREDAPWPEAIALPTASGKTACLDIAIFALAAQAGRLARQQTITAPRRIFFVVDRRVIVDAAHERAQGLADRLESAEEGILKIVADSLCQIARGELTGSNDVRPLSAHVLRGGMYRSEAWAHNPLQPTVVASTVDQIGSRLLFRAYGRRHHGTWPIYAGLVANDSLILLDEAHCAQPFLQTLQSVRRFQGWAQAPLGRPFHPVVMSATPPPIISDVFADQSDDGRNPAHPMGRRQLARKPATLKTVAKARGKRATSELAKAMAETAAGLVSKERRAIVVFVNRVATARETYRLLQSREDIDTVLLTGRMRPVDKEVVLQRLEPLKSSRSAERTLAKPMIVVATQTLEVGADLDFDDLVTECASLDALRQRFGRLNRMGRKIDARAAILIRRDQNGDKGDDPVYGEALTKTWNWLNEHKNENGEVDFGIAYLPDGDFSLNAPSADAPVMLPAHVDCLAQTAPEPDPSPDLAPFLHGPREGAADVQVCWRTDMDLVQEKKTALGLLALCPPSSSETLPVPVGMFKRWLAGEDAPDDSADVEGIGAQADVSGNGSSTVERLVVRWRGAETEAGEDITAEPKKIRPGDVIVIPDNHPGDPRQLGDLPLGAGDVGDSAYRLARAKPILRLHPNLVDDWPDSVMAKGTADELLKDLEQKYDDDPHEVGNTLRELLQELAGSKSLPEHWSWLPKAAKELSKEYSGPKLARAYRVVGGKSIVLVGRQRIPELTCEADHFSDEDDASASGIGRPIKLLSHLSGVKALARCHAAGCGLPDDLVDAIACAGLLHDLGKADPRFQSLLRGGTHWLGGERLAKSAEVPRSPAAYEKARIASGYPKGWRHELLSVRLAESATVLLPERDDLRDLVLHLIASHHGYCRPFAPVVFDEQGVDIDFELRDQRTYWSGPTGLERLDSGVADRYWKLVRRYGWWGLAWLEALLRLADWRQSGLEETYDDK